VTSIDQIRILGLGGSTKPNSSSEKTLRIAARAAATAGAEVKLIVGRDLLLPIYDTENTDRVPAARNLLEELKRADGLIVSSPGYHGGISGMIKNALDYVEDLREHERVYLDGLAVGCIAVAYGWQTSVSTLQSLRATVHALRGWPTPMGAAVNSSPQTFGQSDECVDVSTAFQLSTIGRQVVEFALMKRHAQSAISAI
jgi:FMN reductase